MAILEKIRNSAIQGVTKTLIGSGQFSRWLEELDTASDQEVISFVRRLSFSIGALARFSAKAAKYQRQLDWVASFMEQPGNSALPILRRILALNPKSRDRLLTNIGLYGTVPGGLRREEIERERGFIPPFFLVISPTMKCNLHCDNCYALEFDRQEILPFWVMDSVCTQMEEIGCGFITISGGEPYLYRDPETGQTIWDLFASHPKIFFQTYTNGTLLANEEVIAKMLELGNVAPTISVEGLEKETVSRRGKDCWDKIILAMRLMKEARLPFGFSATVTRFNVDTIASDAFVDYWIEKGCFFGWTFILICMGAGNVDAMLLPEQRDRLREFTTIYARRSKPILWFDFWNDGCLVDGCIAGGQHCHVLADGRVTACVFSPFAPPGYNVKDQPLLDILEKAPYFQRVRHYKEERKRNPLLPCMVIDEPYHLAWSVQEGGAEPAYRGAEALVEPAMTQLLEARAEPYRVLAEEAWRKGYPWATAKQRQNSS